MLETDLYSRLAVSLVPGYVSVMYEQGLRQHTLSIKPYIGQLSAVKYSKYSEMHLFKFLKEVKTEMRSVVWPSKKEVYTISSVVGVVIFISSLFFLLADYTIYNLIQLFWTFKG